MTIPDRINARWLATLANDQLVHVEALLHDMFHQQEKREKSRSGSRYVLLQGPPALVNAWLRWRLVNNETTVRGIVVSRAR